MTTCQLVSLLIPYKTKTIGYYRLGVESGALERAQDEQGWCVLATTVGAEGCADTEVLQAYQAQNTPGEPGFRWIKNPAAITPVWLEKPERMAT
jgi:hypothetical protein